MLVFGRRAPVNEAALAEIRASRLTIRRLGKQRSGDQDDLTVRDTEGSTDERAAMVAGVYAD